MLTVLGKTDDGPLLILGLSHENLRRLKEGQPISIMNLKKQQLHGANQILIFSGESEEAMMEEIMDLAKECGIKVHKGGDRPKGF